MNKNIFNIHENDEMFLYSRDPGIPEKQVRSDYLATGYLIWQQIKSVLETFNKDISSIDSLLDFASGYGRVTRFIAEEIPPQNITVSDIYPDAVEFQINNFYVNGKVSSKNPQGLNLGGDFSVITCVSLFSHLPKDLFVAWLDYLVSLLKDDGLLIFTTHSLGFMGKFGMKFVYRKVSESRTLETDIYGTSYVSRGFIEGIVKNRHPDKKVVCYAPKFLAGRQDLYVIGNASRVYREVTWPGLISSSIDKITYDGKKLIIYGWAYSKLSREPASEIKVFSASSECSCESALGQTRKDVAKYFNDDAAEYTGFTSVVDFPDNCCPEIRLDFRSKSGIKGAQYLVVPDLVDSVTAAIS